MLKSIVQWAINEPKSKPKIVKSDSISATIFGRLPLLLPDFGVDDFGRFQKRLGLLNREGIVPVVGEKVIDARVKGFAYSP